MPNNFVEESYVLDTHSILNDLKRIREGETVDGMITIHNETKGIQLHYWSLDKHGEKYIVLSLLNVEPQEIALQSFPLKYGDRSFYTCPSCLKRCNKLYVRSDEWTGFKCVRCQGLRYRLTSLNLYSRIGRMAYRTDQLDKFFNNGKKTPRIFYRGQETKPFIAYSKKMWKLGMQDKVQYGFKLISEIKNASQRFSAMSNDFGKSGNLAGRRTNL